MKPRFLDSVNTGRQWKRGGWSIWLVESTCTHTRSQGGKHWARGFLRWRIDFLDIVVRLSRFTTGLPDVQSAALTYPHCVNVNIDFWQLLRNEHCHHRGRKGAHEVHTQLAHTHSLSLSHFLSRSPTLSSTRFVIAVYSTISRHASPRLPCFFDRTGNVVRSRDASRGETKFIEFVQFFQSESSPFRRKFYRYGSICSNRKRVFGGREVETKVEINWKMKFNDL